MIKSKKDGSVIKGYSIDIVFELLSILENQGLQQALEDVVSMMNVNIISGKGLPKEPELLHNLEQILEICKKL